MGFALAPLSFERAAYVADIGDDNRAVVSQRPDYGCRRYYTPEDFFRIIGGDDGWRVEAQVILSEFHPEIAEAFASSGIEDTSFPLRRDVIDALDVFNDKISQPYWWLETR